MRNIKWIFPLLVLGLCGCAGVAKPTRITSGVYPWKDAPVKATETGSKRVLVKGAATDFASLEITATTLEMGKGEPESVHVDFEEMVVVKQGSLKITINGEAQTAGRGSMAIVMPGDRRSYTNAADGQTIYYVLRYRARNPADAGRGEKSGGSFIRDWNDVQLTSRSDGKGGTRNFFARSTVMGRRLELHATLLNPGQSSHAPHRHRAEEMLIILEADVEMYLGPGATDGKTRTATDGDIIYLVSNEYHAISNIGSKPALYFAFQFE